MKKKLFFAFASLIFVNAHAGGGGLSGGATELTQLANKAQLVAAYTTQVEQYTRQGLQLQAQLQNLIKNPTSALGSDVGGLINNMGKIWNGANQIGRDVATIDRNFGLMFKSDKALDFAKLFTQWHKTNTDTLESALKSVGLHRENFDTTQQALTELYSRSQSTQGNLDALQTLSQINIRQIQEMQKLQELMANQSQAALTYMATQNAKEEKHIHDIEGISQTQEPGFKIKSGKPIKWY